MAMVLMDTGAEQILNSYFKKIEPSTGNNLTLKLFVNNITPADDDVVGDYTEAAGGGYAAKTLIAASFTVSDVSGIMQAAYAQQQFVFTGPLTTNPTIYGAYIVDADGVLICAELAPADYTPVSNGDLYAVTPTFKLSKGTPT
jgi:hypothetical protein